MFEKWEEKTLPLEEANRLILTKQGVFVKMDGDKLVLKVKVSREELKRRKEEAKAKKEEEKRQKAIEKHSELKKEITDIPPPVAPAEPPKGSPLEEESIGEFVNFEIGKEKSGKRVTVVRGRVKVRPDRFGRLKNKFFFQWDRGAYFVRLDKLIEVEVKTGFRRKKIEKVRKLVYDIMWHEPLNQDGSVTWDAESEEVLTDSAADQYITAATFEGGFQLTPQLIKILVVVGFLGAFFGLALNGTVHITPITIVHWIP